MKAEDLALVITAYINDKGDSISHKKLQKLLYYTEAWHLVNFGEPLLEEEFEAWIHGPVIPSIYRTFKDFGYNDFHVINDQDSTVDEKINEIFSKNKLTDHQMQYIYAVLDQYGGLTSFQLELLSHSEAPWIEARNGKAPHERCNNVISKQRMMEYYSSVG